MLDGRDRGVGTAGTVVEVGKLQWLGVLVVNGLDVARVALVVGGLGQLLGLDWTLGLWCGLKDALAHALELACTEAANGRVLAVVLEEELAEVRWVSDVVLNKTDTVWQTLVDVSVRSVCLGLTKDARGKSCEERDDWGDGVHVDRRDEVLKVIMCRYYNYVVE